MKAKSACSNKMKIGQYKIGVSKQVVGSLRAGEEEEGGG